MIHIGSDTTSQVLSKSLSKNGGISHYRGLIDIKSSAKRSVSEVTCDGLILDVNSISHTTPTIRVNSADALVSQEASV